MCHKIKLIWDFRGANAFKIAEHYTIHLKEYIDHENIKDSFAEVEEISSMHSISYLVVDESLMNQLRKKLKPQRAQKYLKN